jgi:hypothetical protein
LSRLPVLYVDCGLNRKNILLILDRFPNAVFD